MADHARDRDVAAVLTTGDNFYYDGTDELMDPFRPRIQLPMVRSRRRQLCGDRRRWSFPHRLAECPAGHPEMLAGERTQNFTILELDVTLNVTTVHADSDVIARSSLDLP